jgi:hypothetical protein
MRRAWRNSSNPYLNPCSFYETKDIIDSFPLIHPSLDPFSCFTIKQNGRIRVNLSKSKALKITKKVKGMHESLHQKWNNIEDCK